MQEVKLKYRPEDYPNMADELIRCGKELKLDLAYDKLKSEEI